MTEIEHKLLLTIGSAIEKMMTGEREASAVRLLHDTLHEVIDEDEKNESGLGFDVHRWRRAFVEFDRWLVEEMRKGLEKWTSREEGLQEMRTELYLKLSDEGLVMPKLVRKAQGT